MDTLSTVWKKSWYHPHKEQKWVVVSQSCASAVEFLGTNQDACRGIHSGICVLSLFTGESGKLWTVEEGVQLRTHRPDAPLTMCDHHGGDSSQVRGLHCCSLRRLLYVILPSYEQHPSPFKETEAEKYLNHLPEVTEMSGG